MVPSPDSGCPNAIAGIATPDGTYVASSCTNMRITSDNGTLEIRSTNEGINLEAVGASTSAFYLKPVIDQSGECLPNPDAATWVYSSEVILGTAERSQVYKIFDQNTNGYITSGGVDCFFVHEVNLQQSLTTCSDCLGNEPLNGFYNRCVYEEGQENLPSGFFNTKPTITIALPSTGASFPSKILGVEQGTGNAACYNFGGETPAAVDTEYTVTVLTDDQNCNTRPCLSIPSLYGYTPCTECDDPTSLGTIYSTTDLRSKSVNIVSDTFSGCWQPIGNAGEEAEETAGVSVRDFSDGKDQTCAQRAAGGTCTDTVREFSVCPEQDSRLPEKIYLSKTIYANGNKLLVTLISGLKGCYSPGNETCDIVTETQTVVDTGIQGCDRGDGDPCFGKYKYESCNLSGKGIIYSENPIREGQGQDRPLFRVGCYIYNTERVSQEPTNEPDVNPDDIVFLDGDPGTCEVLTTLHQFLACGTSGFIAYALCDDRECGQYKPEQVYVTEQFKEDIPCYTYKGIITVLPDEMPAVVFSCPSDAKADEDGCSSARCKSEPVEPAYLITRENDCNGVPTLTPIDNATGTMFDLSGIIPNLGDTAAIKILNDKTGLTFCATVSNRNTTPTGSLTMSSFIAIEDCSDAQCGGEPEENYIFVKCPNVAGESCSSMPTEVTLALPSAPQAGESYVVRANTGTGQCCYSFFQATTNKPTSGYTLVAGRISCEELPEQCKDEDKNSYWTGTSCDGSVRNVRIVYNDGNPNDIGSIKVRLLDGTQICMAASWESTTNASVTATIVESFADCNTCEGNKYYALQKCDDCPNELAFNIDIEESRVTAVGGGIGTTVLVKSTRDNLSCCYTIVNLLDGNNDDTIYQITGVVTGCEDDSCPKKEEKEYYVLQKCDDCADSNLPSVVNISTDKMSSGIGQYWLLSRSLPTAGSCCYRVIDQLKGTNDDPEYTTPPPAVVDCKDTKCGEELKVYESDTLCPDSSCGDNVINSVRVETSEDLAQPLIGALVTPDDASYDPCCYIDWELVENKPPTAVINETFFGCNSKPRDCDQGPGEQVYKWVRCKTATCTVDGMDADNAIYTDGSNAPAFTVILATDKRGQACCFELEGLVPAVALTADLSLTDMEDNCADARCPR